MKTRWFSVSNLRFQPNPSDKFWKLPQCKSAWILMTVDGYFRIWKDGKNAENLKEIGPTVPKIEFFCLANLDLGWLSCAFDPNPTKKWLFFIFDPFLAKIDFWWPFDNFAMKFLQKQSPEVAGQANDYGNARTLRKILSNSNC